MKCRRFLFLLSILCMLFVDTGCKQEPMPSRKTTHLRMLLAEAKTIADTAREGYGPGLYPPGSVDRLRLMIDSAKNLKVESVTQFGIDLAGNMMNRAILAFKGSIQMSRQLYFDGSGYLDGGIATPFNTAYITLEAWIYPTEWKNAMYVISTEGRKTGYKLQVPNKKPTFQIGIGSKVVAVTAPLPIALNEWTHLAASFDGEEMKLYVNGSLVSHRELEYAIVDNGQNFRIGEGSQFTHRTFKGRIRDVRIWNYALSDRDIAQSLTDKLNGTEEGLTAYWPFNLSGGNTITDLTGDHNIRLINMQYVDPL